MPPFPTISPAGSLAALTLLCALTACMSPLFAFALEALHRFSRPAFARRLFRHVLTLPIITLPLAALLAVGLDSLAAPVGSETPQRFFADPGAGMLLVPGVAAALLLLFTALVRFLPAPHRIPAGLHLLLGALAALLGLAAAALWLESVLAFLFPPTAPASLWDFSALAARPFLAAAALFGGMGSTACLTLPLLLRRRNRDDFGRDYYVWSFTLVSRWAVPALLLCALSLALGNSGMLRRISDLALPLGLVALLVTLVLALFVRIGASATPLRHKISVAALPCCWYGVLMLVLALSGL